MNPRRRRRRDTKKLDALKASAIILGLLLGILIVLWAVTRALQVPPSEPVPSPRPGTSLWEAPAPTR